MITNNERSQLKALIQDPKFRAVEHISDELCDKIAYESPIRESQWDTIKETLIQEGKVRGIKQLIQELYEEAGKIE